MPCVTTDKQAQSLFRTMSGGEVSKKSALGTKTALTKFPVFILHASEEAKS